MPPLLAWRAPMAWASTISSMSSTSICFGISRLNGHGVFDGPQRAFGECPMPLSTAVSQLHDHPGTMVVHRARDPLQPRDDLGNQARGSPGTS